MKDLKFFEIVSENRKIKNALNGTPFRVTILSNITINPLKDILEYVLGIGGIKSNVKIGDYDNILQDAEKFCDSDAFIVFWEAVNYIPNLSYNANLLSSEELDQILNKCSIEIELLLKTLKNAPLILFNKFSSLAFNHNQFQADGFDVLVKRMNFVLESYSEKNLFIVDLDRIIASLGIVNAISLQNFYASTALYTLPMLKQYVAQVAPALMPLRGKIKKVLILDCDYTLWPGVLGEDGVSNILAKYETPIGKPYREIQAIVATLVKKGILVGICSKNNEQDVIKFFNVDKELKLREEHLCIKKVNWEDKASNIKDIAKILNVGLDSIVFVDDSDFETQLVQKLLPEVMVFQVPTNVYDYPAMMRKLANNFFILSRTVEDEKKLEMYRSENVRTEAKNSFENLDDYLRYLELSVCVTLNPRSLSNRLSQLTQKTNQFNLTTHRYSETEIDNFLASEKYQVYALDVNDRFGTYGTVGLVIVEFNRTEFSATIDTFLMSCRTMGRKVEFAFFDAILKDLWKFDVKHLYAKYSPTEKNNPVSFVYEELGFVLLTEPESNGTKMYVFDLKVPRTESYSYIKRELCYAQ